MSLFFISCLASIITNNINSSYQESIRQEHLHPTVILTVSLNLNGGNELILSDNSHSIVNPEDTETSSPWLSPFVMEVLPGGSDGYPVGLIYLLAQEHIRVPPFVRSSC